MGTLLGIQEGSFAGEESQESWLKDRKGKYSVVFEVLADSPEEPWGHVLYETPGLPGMLQDYFHDGCRCKKRAPKETHTVTYNGTPTVLWEIACDFDSEVEYKEQTEEEREPTEWPTTLSISTQEVTEDLLQDPVTKQPVVNPNGERIHIELTNSYPVIEFSRYEAYPDTPAGVAAIVSKINRYKNRVNKTPFLGFPAGTCFLYAPVATREKINGAYFFKMTYRILIKAEEGDEPFVAKPLCEGYLVRDANNGGKVVSTADLYGQNIRVNLDKQGHVLQDGAPPVYLSFHQYQQADFNDLRLT